MTSLAGKRILILEDEVLLALDAADCLEEAGAVIIGPVHRVPAALELLATTSPDAALLDVNIAGITSADVARRLSDMCVPFVLATGYGNRSDVSGARAIIDKPYNRRHLQSAFAALFEKTGAESTMPADTKVA